MRFDLCIALILFRAVGYFTAKRFSFCVPAPRQVFWSIGNNFYGLWVVVIAVVGATSTAPAQTPLPSVAVPWGGELPVPRFGYYARVVNQHSLPDCQIQPLTPNLRDWRNPVFRQKIASLKPQILRFPDGTGANFWYWENETRQLVGNSGQLRTLQICEASFIDVPPSRNIGCPGNLQDFTADKFETVVRKTSTTLAHFRDAVIDMRNNMGVDVRELFVLGPIDPFYYVGSPQLEFETPGFTVAAKRERIALRAYQRMLKQINRILSVYCPGCTTYDGEIDFEIGNEIFLSKYGRFFPSESCFGMSPAERCSLCRVDADFYFDLCDSIIPQIRQRFPNARIAVVGGRASVAGKPWTGAILQRFGPQGNNPVEGVVVHFYPRPISLANIQPSDCNFTPDVIDYQDLMHQTMAEMNDFYVTRAVAPLANSGMEMWPTEFNTKNRNELCSEFEEVGTGDPAYYHGRWVHTLNVFNIFNGLLQYASPTPDPWLNNTGMIAVQNMAMHSLFGNPHASAMLQDYGISAAGIASTTLQELFLGADAIRQVLVAPSQNVTINAQGVWTANVPTGVPMPYHTTLLRDLPPPQNIQHLNTTYGWNFTSTESNKLLLVNTQAVPLSVALGTIPGFATAATTGQIYHVPVSQLDQLISTGLQSAHVQQSTHQGSGAITLPPYSFAVVTGVVPTPCPNGAIAINGVCPCSFQLVNFSNFETPSTVWFPGGDQAVIWPTNSAFPEQAGAFVMRLSHNTPGSHIATPTVAAAWVDRLRLTFDFGTASMQSPSDRLEVAVSLNGGTSYTTIKAFYFGVDVQNGVPAQADILIEGPFSNQFRIRIQSVASGPVRSWFIDNIRIFVCNSNSAQLTQSGNGGLELPESRQSDLRLSSGRVEWSVWPNPANDVLYVSALLNDDTPKLATLHNTDGRVVKTFGVSHLGPTHVPIADLPAGLYMLRMDGVTQGHKVVVRH